MDYLKLGSIKRKLRETYLTPKGEREYDSFKRDGYLDAYMITLNGPPRQSHKPKEWLIAKWKLTVNAWEAEHAKSMNGWMLVATRGHDGNGRAHAHVVFKGPRAPKNFEFLLRYWKNHFGTVRPKTMQEARHNKNGLRYWTKNYNEPDPTVEVG